VNGERGGRAAATDAARPSAPGPFGRQGGRPGGVGAFTGRGPLSVVVEKPKDFLGTLKRLVVYLKPHSARIYAVIAFAVLSTGFSILGPKIMGNATTRLFHGIIAKVAAHRMHQPVPTIDFTYIGSILAALLGLYLTSAAFGFAQQSIMAGVSQRTVFDMRRDANDKLARLPLKYLDSRVHGEIMSRITNDIDNISSTLQQSMTQLITSVCTILGVVVMMLSISPLLTAIAIVTLPMSFVGTSTIARHSQRHFVAQQRVLGELNGHIEEMYTGHTVVKAFRHETRSVQEFREINDRLYRAAWRAQFVSGLIFPMMRFVNNIGYVIVCVVGGIYVTRKLIELGDVQAFLQYSRQFTQPIIQTASIANILQSTIASAERVFELLDEAEEVPEAPDARSIAAPRGAVRFEHVKFGYSPDTPLMEDMSIDVAPGRTIAIVGPTGAGKTTLVNLLMRFYEIDSGRITVDGIDIRDLRRSSLRTMFGMVLQDTWLFNGTIMENIAYGREGATEEEIVQAARAAHADHFVRALPEGYGTVLNEEASTLSQGERQLLTIARAILADPAILILDEATSSVDTRTEVHIQKAMQELMKGRTSFVIAHRLSTIRDAETILVMNNGSIIEMGNHRDLLARAGFYAELYYSQFTGAANVNAHRAG
jgi:ATP-binding cassette subfamily B multidrug efflux pump